MKKYSAKLILLLSIVFLISLSPQSAFSQKGEDNKVIFEISDATNFHESGKVNDDFDEFSHYENYAGCKYEITIKQKEKLK